MFQLKSMPRDLNAEIHFIKYFPTSNGAVAWFKFISMFRKYGEVHYRILLVLRSSYIPFKYLTA